MEFERPYHLCDLNRPIVMAAMPGSISEDQLSVSDEQYFAKIIKEDRPRVIQAYRDLADGKIEKVKEGIPRAGQ